MVLWGELRVEATLENLRKVSEFVRHIGQQLQLTKEAMFDVELAVEEASANIVRHAYPPGQAGDNRAACRTNSETLRRCREDGGDMKIAGLSERLARVFRIVGFDVLMSVHDTPEAAISEFSASAAS